MTKPCIIAEAGSNYNGSVDQAKMLAYIAKECDADIVKYQTIYTEELYNTYSSSHGYGHYSYTDILRFRRECELELDEWQDIADYCKEIEIAFSTSIFGSRSLEVALACKCSILKIASTDWDNFSLIKACANKLADEASPKPQLVLSTGMTTLQQLQNSLPIVEELTNGLELVLMHCVSAYPCQLSNASLGRISWLLNNTTSKIGFSDHTTNSSAAMIALGQGATVFEKHFTHDNNAQGLDHKYASNPDDLRNYCRDIRHGWEAICDLRIEMSSEEEYTSRRAKRGYYARKEIKKNDLLNEDNILLVRPPTDIPQSKFNAIIGKKATRDITEGDVISGEDLI